MPSYAPARGMASQWEPVTTAPATMHSTSASLLTLDQGMTHCIIYAYPLQQGMDHGANACVMGSPAQPQPSQYAVAGSEGNASLLLNGIKEQGHGVPAERSEPSHRPKMLPMASSLIPSPASFMRPFT